MKKYLIVGALALVAGLFVTSCTHDDDVYGSGDLATEKTEAFQKAFVSAFGQINANQNWGFYDEDLAGITAAATRAAARTRTIIKQDETNYPAATAPDPVTQKEAEYVFDWFKKAENKGLTENGQPWKNFYIQQVWGTMDQQKQGIWHRYDQNRINNGYDSNYYDETFTDKGGMDYLMVGDGTNMEHVKDFNAEMGGPFGVIYIQNGSAMKFGYHSSWDSSDRQLFKLAQIEVPGSCFEDGQARTGWYVGLSLLAEKYDNGNKVLGEQRKDWGDDWILKVVPGEPVKTKEERDRTFSTWGTPGRVLCEDLGNVSYNDIDYNDVVFDAQIEHRVVKHYVDWYYDGEFHHTDESTKEDNYYAHITLLAAGGTMPLTVAGVEVHNAFGVGVATMVNTVTEHNQNVVGSYVTRDYVNLGEFEGYERIDDIPVIVNYTSSTGGAAVELKTTPGLAPHKILVLADYTDDNGNTVKGTDWPCERANLGDAYPGFKQYVASPKQDDATGEFIYDANGNLVFEGGKDYAGEKFWEDGSDADYLFHSWVSANSGEARYTTTTKEERTDDGRTIYIIYYEEGNGYDISTPLYFTNKTQLTDLNIAANDVIRIYGTAADPTNWHIGISNGNSKSVAVAGSTQGNWTGYVDIILTEDMVTKLKEGSSMAAMIISGTGIVLTEVDLIKAK